MPGTPRKDEKMRHAPAFYMAEFVIVFFISALIFGFAALTIINWSRIRYWFSEEFWR